MRLLWWRKSKAERIREKALEQVIEEETHRLNLPTDWKFPRGMSTTETRDNSFNDALRAERHRIKMMSDEEYDVWRKHNMYYQHVGAGRWEWRPKTDVRKRLEGSIKESIDEKRVKQITEKEDIVVRCHGCGFPAAADPSLFPEGKQYIIRKCEACGTRHRMIRAKET